MSISGICLEHSPIFMDYKLIKNKNALDEEHKYWIHQETPIEDIYIDAKALEFNFGLKTEWKDFKIEKNPLRDEYTITFISSEPFKNWSVILSKENLIALLQLLGNTYSQMQDEK